MAAISFSGLASGIDTSSLITSLLDQERKVKITPLSTQIETLTSRNESFAKLTELLNSIKSQASEFRALNGGALRKNAASTDDSTVTASATNSAVNGSYQLSVSQIAKNSTYSFGSSSTQYSSGSSYISGGSAFSDTINVVIGDPLSPLDTVSININETTTLSQFVQDFNSKTSNATASLVNTGTSSQPNYKVVIASSRTGEAEGSLTVSGGTTLQSRLAFDNNQQSQAQNAVFSIAGVASNIERGSNSITDVLEGVTLNLRDTGTVKISIDVDKEGSTTKVRKLIDSINKALGYITENDAVTQESSNGETINTFGPLATTSIDDNFVSSFRDAISRSSVSGGLVNIFADLGITTERDGSLKFDEKVFSDALSSDPNSVAKILENFAEKIAATDGLIAQYTRFNGILDLSENSNTSIIEQLNKRISETESNLSKYEASLKQRFSNLEVISGKLQSAQAALASLG